MVNKLLTYMEQNSIDSFFVSKPANVRYISGYTGDDSFLLITNKEKFFITDPRYTEQAAVECPEYELVNWRLPGNTIGATIAELTATKKYTNVAFEADEITYEKYKELEEKIRAELIPVKDVIENFRAIKSTKEIEKLRISCDIASRAFEKIIKDIRVGVTEKELASKLSHYMVMEGADTKPYGGILTSGARTSLLHGIPSSKALEYGDFVLMDYGCQYDGYLSDMTRTVVVGKAT
ncbi:MAG: Xaa-Pro peptidase family protein, partial [Lachnospiraceae bacterium]|nr:Xaa-Pro peptidase family protein [Lachnospiraceae bacterium]